MKPGIKKSITVELTPTEMSIVNAHQTANGCSRMSSIRTLIRGSTEEQRLSKNLQLLDAKIDALSSRVTVMAEILQQLTAATRDIRLGVAFSKIAIEELNKANPAMPKITQRYESLKGNR